MLQEGLAGLGILVGYFILAALSTVLLKKLVRIPQEPTRKILHIICVLSIFVLLYAFQTWYVAALSAVTLAVVIYPILSFAERFPRYSAMLTERRAGEVKTSMIIAFLMMAVLIAVFWGWQGAESKYIIVVAVMAWGLGDAAAALVGKAYGRHYIDARLTVGKASGPHYIDARLIEGRKTVEGTLSMYGVSSLAIFTITQFYTALPWYICLLIALLVAPICAIVELFSRWGLDTITVPFAAALSAFALVSLIA